MTPAAYERWRVRLPLAAIAAACWVLLIGSSQHELAVYCSAGFRISLDRLSSAAAFYPPGYLAWDWGLMVAAMMVPMLTRPIGHVRARTLPHRRGRATLMFAAGYCLVWLACGVPIMAVVLALSTIGLPPLGTAAVAAAIAAVWQCSPAKQVCLNRCHSQPPLAVHGMRADLDVFRYGAMQGLWCCGTCWAAMLIPLTVQGLHLLAMAATSAFVAAERMDAPRPPAWSPRWPSAIFRLVWFRLRQVWPAQEPAQARR
jgi:predicted metal-binding membrane protein